MLPQNAAKARMGSMAANLQNRTVYLRVRPKPESLAERRAVIRMLQRHGEVEVFKKLRRPDSFITVMRTAREAIDFVKRSPVQYELVTERSGVNLIGGREITASVDPIETAPSPQCTDDNRDKQSYAELQTDEPNPKDLPKMPRQQHEADADNALLPNAAPSVRQRSFVLSAYITNRHAHYMHIRRSPLYGPWPVDKHAQDTFMTQALARLVPDDFDTRAFANWAAADQLNESWLEEFEEGKRSGGGGNVHFQLREARRNAALAPPTSQA